MLAGQRQKATGQRVSVEIQHGFIQGALTFCQAFSKFHKYRYEYPLNTGFGIFSSWRSERCQKSILKVRDDGDITVADN
jgi:hypothetical protein